MARLIEFSRRSTVQLQKILEFYDERNGNDAYSRRLLKSLLSDLQQKAMTPTASRLRRRRFSMSPRSFRTVYVTDHSLDYWGQ